MSRLQRSTIATTPTVQEVSATATGARVDAIPVIAPDAEEERRHARRALPTRLQRDVKIENNRASALWTTAFSVGIFGLLLLGLEQSIENQITPKDGLGYYIGIIGALMMLSLLLYPARKQYKAMQSLGSMRAWFQAHMIIGVVGPALVVIHSGFEMSSKNGAVAMISMLLVVASGIIGRYVYSKLHVGLYGRRAEINELIKAIEQFEAALAVGSAIPVEVLSQLRALAESTLSSTKGLGGTLSFRAMRPARASLKRSLHTEIEASTAAAALRSRASPALLRAELDKAHANLDSYFLTVEQIGSVRLYERLFHAWHLLHLPLFFLLIVTAVLHVVAVHLY